MRTLSAADFLPAQVYRGQRKEWFKKGIEQSESSFSVGCLLLIHLLGKLRRVLLGPHASISFQSRDLVWIQIQESILAEPKTSIEEELEAYGPLVPNGNNLVFTLFFEIDSPVARQNILTKLGGVEQMITLILGSSGKIVTSIPADDDGVARVTKVRFVGLSFFSVVSKHSFDRILLLYFGSSRTERLQRFIFCSFLFLLQMQMLREMALFKLLVNIPITCTLLQYLKLHGQR
jgi:hypothetical protein